jgi:HTH-type transcriptional regulator / antitoxin HigA
VEGVTDAKPRRMQTVDAWSSLADTVFVPHTEAEYQKLITLLDRLVDEVGENESYPLASLTEIVGVLIEKYEDELSRSSRSNSRVLILIRLM